MLQKMYTFIIQRGYMGSLIMLTGLAIMSFMDIKRRAVPVYMKMCIRDRLIIVISAAMAVISMFMTDNSDKLFCSIKRPEPGEESQVKRINVIGEDGESITSVDVEIAPRIMTQDEAAGCFEKAYEEIAGIMCGRNKDLEHVRCV